MGKAADSFQQANGTLKEEILEQIPTTVIAVDNDMRVIYINTIGCKTANMKREEIIGEQCFKMFKSAHCGTPDCCVAQAMKTGKILSARNEVTIGTEKIPVQYTAVPLKNEKGEVIGGLEFAMDITENVLYEQKLREQSHTIREMSTPTIKLWEGVLVLPVVGVVDSMRAQHMMETMLNKIAETYSRVIILDIHGVAAVDTAVANHLIKIAKATKLMGCECILSGISPAVAQTIIQLGIDMTAINTKSTLSGALSEAFGMLDLEVKDKH